MKILNIESDYDLVLPDSEVFHFLTVLLKKEGNFGKKAEILASQFSTLKAFKNTDFKTAKFIRSGDKTEITLRDNERKMAEKIKEHINPNSSLPENWIRFTMHRIIHKFLHNMNSLSLSEINMNPFLIRALNLQVPEEVIRFNVYQAVTRSIVTSMGMSLEYMIGNSGARMGERGEWYDIVKEIGDSTYWIQVKSGPNNVNKDQIDRFNQKFDETEKKKNQFARLGITYGKRGLNTVSIGLVKKYMTDWEKRLLIGRELWDFVSEEKNYHVKVLKWVDDVASKILKNHSIDDEISKCISRLATDFEKKYGSGKDGVQKYLTESL